MKVRPVTQVRSGGLGERGELFTGGDAERGTSGLGEGVGGQEHQSNRHGFD